MSSDKYNVTNSYTNKANPICSLASLLKRKPNNMYLEAIGIFLLQAICITILTFCLGMVVVITIVALFHIVRGLLFPDLLEEELLQRSTQSLDMAALSTRQLEVVLEDVTLELKMRKEDLQVAQ